MFHDVFQSDNNLTHTDTMYKPNNVLIHLQNKSRDGSDKTILKRDNTNINNKTKAKDYGKKLFAIECGNVVLVVRPNGDTVIVTEAGELVLDNAVMEQLVRNSGAYKSFVATKDDVVAGLERDNAELQNEIVGLKKSLKVSKVLMIMMIFIGLNVRELSLGVIS